MRRLRKGISLIEVLIAAGALAVTVVALFQVFIYCFSLVEVSRNLTFALSAAEDKIEEIRDQAAQDFSQVMALYPNQTFAVNQLPEASGVVYVYDKPTDLPVSRQGDFPFLDADLVRVKVSVSWRSSRGRLSGEDANFNGTLDAGEDQNNNGELDSPATIETLLARH